MTTALQLQAGCTNGSQPTTEHAVSLYICSHSWNATAKNHVMTTVTGGRCRQ